MITTVGLISFGTWIGNKIADKGFDSIYETLLSIDEKNKFYKIVDKTAKKIQEKYPTILGGSIEHFFRHEEIFDELIKVLFHDSKVDIKVINEQFDIDTLPDDFILEFVELLRSNLHRDKDFSKILSDKELYVACLGVNTNLESINQITNLSLEEIKKIRKLLEDKFNDAFNTDDFREQYLVNALNILSQVNFIGLGIDSSIRKGKRKKN